MSSAPSLLGTTAMIGFFFLLVLLIASSRLPHVVKVLLTAGLMFRLIGATLRYLVLFNYYDGSGDARVYYTTGLRFAEFFKSFDFSPLFDSRHWGGGSVWGTDFVRLVSGGVLSLIGPSLYREFVVFALFAFVGLVAFAVGFRRSYASRAFPNYLLAVLLFPSLWYWPSSVGKEAVLLMGLGLSFLGYVGTGRRINWLLLVIGLFIVFAARPELAGVLLVALILAQWLSFQTRWNAGRIIQAVLILIIGLVGIRYSMQSVGIEQFDVEGIGSYLEANQGRVETGGSTVNPVSGIIGMPLALFNVLFRPLPWEASNVMVLISSMEIWALWTIVFLRRRNLLHNLRHWREDRVLRLSVVFIILYSVALGMMLVNLGIIARQRIFLFPFVFLLLEAAPAATEWGDRREARGTGRKPYVRLPSRSRAP